MANLTLNGGTSVPVLAFGCGTALLKKNREADEIDQGTVETIKSAIRVGYRHLDTAEMYNTEREVGEAIRESIDEGVVERKDLFVTTKIFGNYTQAQTAIDISLHKLKLDYVDSYLIHSPYWTKSETELQAAWAAMESVKESGKARSIGLSNFEEPHIRAVLAAARIPPSINQVELHPYMPQSDLVCFSRSPDAAGIAISAYGALAPVTRNIPGPLDDTLEALAQKYGVSAAVVCMRWCIDQDIVVVTTSRHLERMEEYLRVFDFKLTEREVKEISDKGAITVKGQNAELIPRVVKYYRSKGVDIPGH